MSIVKITVGDDVVLSHQLKKLNETFTISGTATVVSRIVSLDKSVAYCDEVGQLQSNEGSDWTTSLVGLSFSSAITSQINDNVEECLWNNKGELKALVETQVDDSGKETFFATIILRKGTIE